MYEILKRKQTWCPLTEVEQIMLYLYIGILCDVKKKKNLKSSMYIWTPELDGQD